MSEPSAYEDINEGKRNFDAIYNRPEPRGYYQKLGGLDYRIPGVAKPVLETVIAALRDARGTVAPVILDLGCSYGINAALLKYDLAVEDLIARYRRPELRNLSTAEVIAADLQLFEMLDEKTDFQVVGLDVADEAVGYGRATGILDKGFAENLEENEPSPMAASAIGGCDIVMSTGAIGYVTERTFARILEARGDRPPPWIASFVLRMFPYDAIAETLGRFGLETEKLDGRYFAQRRFADGQEERHVVGRVRELGMDPAGLEAEGTYFAEFFLSRPRREIDAVPLDEIAAGLGLSLAESGQVPPDLATTP